jgi:hypothetical protein
MRRAVLARRVVLVADRRRPERATPPPPELEPRPLRTDATVVRARTIRRIVDTDPRVWDCATRDSALRAVLYRCVSLMPAARACAAVGIG